MTRSEKTVVLAVGAVFLALVAVAVDDTLVGTPNPAGSHTWVSGDERLFLNER